MKKFVTPNGKEIEIKYDGRNCKVQFSTGGELPVDLQGEFTSPWFAEMAINKYLGKKEETTTKGK